MVGKLKGDCQKYAGYICEQDLKSYLYQQRVCSGFSESRRLMLCLMKSRESDAKFRIMGGFECLLSKQNNTRMVDDEGGGVLGGFSSSPSDWSLGMSC